MGTGSEVRAFAVNPVNRLRVSNQETRAHNLGFEKY